MVVGMGCGIKVQNVSDGCVNVSLSVACMWSMMRHCENCLCTAPSTASLTGRGYPTSGVSMLHY